MYSVGQWWMWLGFFLFVMLVIGMDLFLLGRKKREKVSTRNALAWVMLWVSCALIFNLWLWWYLRETQGLVIANQKALEFLSGYLIEQSLSVDNMFAFIMIFNYFAIPPEFQRRVLVYGVLSAIVMRLIVILAGVWIVSTLHWILYVFGAFLVFTGIKMLFPEKEEKDLEQNAIVRWMRNHIRLVDKLYEEKFFVKLGKLWYATPLFLVLVLIEISDLVFALDSIPAIFAVTHDVFIIFTSNIFAILGLRALYFLLSNMAEKFYLLRYGIAIMLTFIGTKMLIAPWVKLPIGLALGIMAAILATSMVLSMAIPQTKVKK